MQEVVPEIIEDDEKLLRTTYAPMHFSHSGKLRSSCLKPYTKESDEDNPSMMNNKISVNRLDYSGWRFCINHGLRYQNDIKHFNGFLKLIAGKVRSIGPEPKYKPTEDNPYHSNIVYSEINKPHEDELDELESSRLQAIARELLESGEYISVDTAEQYANKEELEQKRDLRPIATENDGKQSEVLQNTRIESIFHIVKIIIQRVKNWISSLF